MSCNWGWGFFCRLNQRAPRPACPRWLSSCVLSKCRGWEWVEKSDPPKAACEMITSNAKSFAATSSAAAVTAPSRTARQRATQTSGRSDECVFEPCGFHPWWLRYARQELRERSRGFKWRVAMERGKKKIIILQLLSTTFIFCDCLRK